MSEIVHSKAIFLHATKTGESSLVLHTIDRNFGRQSLYLRNAKKSKNSAALSHFFSLNILDTVITAPTKGSMYYLKEFDNEVKLHSIRSDIYKNSIAIYIGELLYRTYQEESGDADFFDWLCQEIITFESLESNFANYHLIFTLEYCKKLGFAPIDNYSEENCIFEINSAKFISEREVNLNENNLYFSKANSLLLHEICGNTFLTNLSIPLCGLERYNFTTELIKYIGFHLEYNLNIKSLNVLHEVLAN